MDIRRHTVPSRVSVAFIIILAMMVMACATPKSATGRPAITFVGLTLSKEVHQKGDIAVPQGVSRIFRVSDKEVVALVSFKNLYGIIDLRWDWYHPDGYLFHTKQTETIRTSEGKYLKEFSAWHVLTIAGDRVAEMPGEWTVKVYMNDDLLASKSFALLEEDE